MTNQFKIGDVVQLASGGPKMTVTDVGNDGFGKPTVWCAWFVSTKDGGLKEENSTFPPAALKTVSV